MLVLNRKEGQWVEITHRSGDVLRIRFYNIQNALEGHRGRLSVAFDDDARNFKVHRPERRQVWRADAAPQPLDALPLPADAVTDLPNAILDDVPVA